MKKCRFLVPVLLLLLLSGCGKSKEVVFEAASEAFSESVQEEQVPEEEETDEAEPAVPATVFVDLGGAVVKPGVYELESGSRVFQAVAAAGGFTDEAETRCVNQADLLYDGEMLYVYTREEAEALGGWRQLAGLEAEGTGKTAAAGEGASAQEQDGKVNLNLADRSSLMTLPGVGEAKADAIIAFRESNGAYQSVEDVMKVSGIKEKLFEQIRDKITV